MVPQWRAAPQPHCAEMRDKQRMRREAQNGPKQSHLQGGYCTRRQDLNETVVTMVEKLVPEEDRTPEYRDMHEPVQKCRLKGEVVRYRHVQEQEGYKEAGFGQ